MIGYLGSRQKPPKTWLGVFSDFLVINVFEKR
jgi:hypothetical protein